MENFIFCAVLELKFDGGPLQWLKKYLVEILYI